MISRLLPLCCLFLLLAACGDAGGTRSTTRDVRAAAAAYRRGVALMPSDPAGAAVQFRAAIAADAYHGQAHNNLGVILLEQGQLSDAAAEFDVARKLLPGQPEPRVNLAITLDRGGRPAAALEAARGALECRAGNLPALEMVATLQIDTHMTDAATVGYLDEIIMRTTDQSWRTWATFERDRLQAAQHAGPGG